MAVDRGPWLADASEYDRLRRRTLAGDPSVALSARQLRLRAEALCRTPAPAVTDKRLQRHAPSRDPHDYVSIGTLPLVLDHLQELSDRAGSPWSEQDQSAMEAWCSEFLAWLDAHPFGRREEEAANNHGVYYDRMVASLALFLGRPERARAQLEKTRQRIATQIEPDGSMPHELDRTCSFGYSLMNLRGFVELAWIGRRIGLDLWSWTTADGRSIGAAADFLWRLACSRGEWPYPQIEPIDWRMLWPVFQKAAGYPGGGTRLPMWRIACSPTSFPTHSPWSSPSTRSGSPETRRRQPEAPPAWPFR